MMLLDITTFLGHLHPMLVHLPIGFLLLAVALELVSYVRKFQHLSASLPFVLCLGFISALAACICGYLLSLTGDYDYQGLNNHKIAGIAVAFVSGALWIMTTLTMKKVLRVNRLAMTGALLILFVLISYTGHQGGSLTHGSDYLSVEVLTESETQPPVTVEEAMLFEQVVQPILKKRCSQCHREDKRKGKLSVRTLADLLKGGKTGPAVTAGKLEESELYKRITLEPSQEKFMPADGKPVLTKGETEIIRWWIEKGNAVAGKKIAELKDGSEIKNQVMLFLGNAEGTGESKLAVSRMVNPDIPSNLNMNLVDSLRSLGVAVRFMQHNPVMLDVTVPAAIQGRLPLISARLKPLAGNVIWLNISSVGWKEKDLDFLPMMVNLEKLRLDRNPVGDEVPGLLAGLHHLEAVNLNETRITKATLEKLKQIPNLKRVYVWKTSAE